MWNANLDTLSILQQFIENSSTYICEDVNSCIVAELSSLKFIFGIYFSRQQ